MEGVVSSVCLGAYMAHEPKPERDPDYDPEAYDASESGDEAAPSGAGRKPVTSADLLGRTLERRYRFDALLGEGTFARVFRVHDLYRRVDLAAKVLRSDIADEPAFLERFRREASVLARLQHPNIVRYYETVDAGGVVFILTDEVSGQTLQSIMRAAGGPISPMDSLVYLTPLAAALHYAHRENIIHRDLKPANILVDDGGNVFITDFGIARILTDTSTLTVDTTVGTPHYMSPEQILAGTVTPATDIYALGVLLYQMYTGRLPFTGDSQGASGATTAVRIVYEHLHVKPTPPHEVNPRVSQAVSDVVMRALEKDPGQRYSTVGQLYDALTDAIGTPSVSLDAAEVAAQAEPRPPYVPVAVGGMADRDSEAERVPTGVGGLSRVAPGGELEDDYEAAAGERKAKRKPKPQADTFGQMGEKEHEKKEKENEKESDWDEKSDEKETEKSEEKGEFWGDVAGSDRLSQFTWGGVVLWAGIAFLLESAGVFSSVMPWLLGGAGAILLAEVGVRMAIPEYRVRPGARLIFGIVFLMLGLGTGFGFGSLWPLILIGIGVGLLINRLFD